VRPTDEELLRLRRDGKSDKEIAQRFGLKEASVRSRWTRMGAPARRDRYTDTIPWTVKSHHDDAYELRMLRLLAQRRRNKKLSSDSANRLQSWLDKLKEENSVVVYAPWSIEGTHPVDQNLVGSTGITDDKGWIPVRPEILTEEEHKRLLAKSQY
jgi:hypothetical protein